MKVQPKSNVFVVIDKATGNQLMHVVDAADPNHPWWNPPNSIQVHIPLIDYATHTFETFDAAVVQGGLAKNVTVKSLIQVSAVVSQNKISA